MKKLVLMTLVVLAGCHSFAGDSVPERAGNGIKKGGEAAARGIEKGVEATSDGLTTAGEWVGRKMHSGDKKSEKAPE